MNVSCSQQIVRKLLEAGVSQFIVCAGSRNSPLLKVLLNQNVCPVYHHFEERSAAFFALGLAKRSCRPVAVVCTSGTAVAEMLPAVIEAYYSGVPLVVLSADRPHRFRGSGAPQAIEQNGLFGSYSSNFDLQTSDPIPNIEINGPTHINIAFDEPLIEEAQLLELPHPGKWSQSLSENYWEEHCHTQFQQALSVARSCTRPIVIASGLRTDLQGRIFELLQATSIPCLLESTSGLRENSDLQRISFRAGDQGLHEFDPDFVLRIGAVPTTRFWRDLENLSVPVVSFAAPHFSGLARDSYHFPLAEDSLIHLQTLIENLPTQLNCPGDESLVERRESLLAEYPQAEPSLVRACSEWIEDGAFIYIGNSQPIRLWDGFASRQKQGLYVAANRGANGIDGQISSFLGMAKDSSKNYCLIGDLTCLYDMNALALLEYCKESTICLVVINNGGGRIFERLPYFSREFAETGSREALLNCHSHRFEHLAKMWSLNYWCVEQASELPELDTGERHNLIEVMPDMQQSEAFWQKLGSF